MLLPNDRFTIHPAEFFARQTTVVAKELLGSVLVRSLDRNVLAARIVETEAYRYDDPACHAFGHTDAEGKVVTNSGRSRDLAAAPGTAYVYLNYGVYWLLNVTTEGEGIPAAVLIRAVEPVFGLPEMIRLRNQQLAGPSLTNGPGKLTQALSINGAFHRHNLGEPPLQLVADRDRIDCEIESGPRIGISKATDLPWRYFLKGNPYVSHATARR